MNTKQKVVACTLLVAATCAVLPVGALLAREAKPEGIPVSARIPEVLMNIPGIPAFVRWEAGADAKRDRSEGKRLLFGYKHGSNVGLGPECTVVSYQPDFGRKTDFPGWWETGIDGCMIVACLPSGAPMQFTVLELGNFLSASEWVYFETYNRSMLRAGRAGYAGRNV